MRESIDTMSVRRPGRSLRVLGSALIVLLGLAVAASTLHAQTPAYRNANNADADQTMTMSDSSSDLPTISLTERYRAQDLLAAFGAMDEALRTAGDTTAKRILEQIGARSVEAPTLTSEGLDALIDEALADQGAQTAPVIDDATFLRRVSLDLTGTPPSPERLEQFLADDRPDKRVRIIDELLASSEYARNWARYWRDVIRYRGTITNPLQARYDVLEEWLDEQFAANEPWDAIASAMITGQGSVNNEGPANFAASHVAEPVEIAGEVSRVFLGIQIQCAQCHDHMTDRWTREQFHHFASFFAGMQLRAVRGESGRPRDYELAATRRPRYAMPDLDNPTSRGTPMDPGFFLDASGQTYPGDLGSSERRQIAAALVTDQDNPWFARAFVNRVWASLMGRAFTPLVDDLGPDHQDEIILPEVFEVLAEQWQRGGYDVAWLFRTLCNTEAYQRTVRPMSSSDESSVFAANCPTRLTADQIFNALVEILEIDTRNPRLAGFERRIKRMEAQGEDTYQIRRRYEAFRNRLDPRRPVLETFGVDPSTPADEVLGTIPQALYLMNNNRLEQALRARPGTMLGRLLQEHPDNDQALDALYDRVYSRAPTIEERRVCLEFIDEVGDRAEAFEDILWSLINAAEFITRR